MLISSIDATVGSILMALCAVPAAWAAWCDEECHYDKRFLWLWLVGEILYLIYAVRTGQYVLLLNYIPNLFCLMIIMRYNK